jgi:Lar family restriction alleviation protein
MSHTKNQPGNEPGIGGKPAESPAISAEELKPCPFCGGKAAPTHHKYEWSASVYCTQCGSSTGTQRGKDENAMAVAAWNTRVSYAATLNNSTAELTWAEVEQILQSHDEEQDRADKAEAERDRLWEALKDAAEELDAYGGYNAAQQALAACEPKEPPRSCETCRNNAGTQRFFNPVICNRCISKANWQPKTTTEDSRRLDEYGSELGGD